MSRAARIAVAHPVAILLAVAGATLLGLSQIVDFRSGTPLLLLDSSFDSLLPAESEGKQFYDTVVRRFGRDDTVLVVLVDDDVFSADVLARVERITERIEDLPTVRQVTSLTTALSIRADGDDLSIEPFLDEIPKTPQGFEELRSHAKQDPIYAGNLFSRDSRATAVIVQPLPMTEQEFINSGLDEEIMRIAGEEGGDSEVLITGGSHIKTEMSRMLLADLSRILPAATLMMVIVAWASFRSVRGVVVPLTTVGIGIVWTLGVVGATVGSLNQVTVAVPPILLVVGFAYAVHVVSAYYDVLYERLDQRATTGVVSSASDAATEAVSRVLVPVILTGVTTAAGFGSLIVSRLGAIQQFGLFTGLGVLFTTIISLSFAPALLALVGEPKSLPKRGDASDRRDLLDRMIQALAIFDVENRTRIFAISGVFALVAVIGMFRIDVNTDFVRNFPEDNAARLDFERVNEILEGSNGFYVVIQGESADSLTEPSNLGEIDALQRWLEEQPEIGGTTSLVDYLKTISQGFNAGDPAYFSIPDNSNLVSQLFLFGANDELKNFVDSRYQSAKIAVRTSAIDTSDLGQLVLRIEDRLKELPARLTARVTGNTVMVTRTLDEIALGQALSLSTAFVIIYAILSALFLSLRVGLLALIPNALPVLAYFGILGWSGVSLNIVTGLVASMVLGIAVDDTIHYLSHFNRSAKASADERTGAVDALRAVGRPVTFTTAALCLGFLALTLSELRNQVQFGLLASSTLAVAWLIDVTLTPALAARMRIVTLWEVLALDLGSEPQRSIPIFRDLSHTQARVVALMSHLQSFPKGHQLIRKGEEGSQMFVVVDGTLRASVGDHGSQVILRDHQRGDVLGEVALFEGRRTANVEALTDVRLIGITQGSLDRLRKRYPRTSAILYRNLAQVLAGRLTNVTERMR